MPREHRVCPSLVTGSMAGGHSPVLHPQLCRVRRVKTFVLIGPEKRRT